MEDWIAEQVGRMHVNKIKQKDIAKKKGVTREYIGMILAGTKTPANAKEMITTAIDEVIAERKNKE